MTGLVIRYFKDARGVWHQPGNKEEFPDRDAEELERSGSIKLIRTAMVGPPNTREKRRKGNVNSPS